MSKSSEIKFKRVVNGANWPVTMASILVETYRAKMNGLNIRYGTAQDLPEIVQMIKDLDKHNHYKPDSPGEKELLAEGFGNGGACNTLLAEIARPNGTTVIIGTVSYSVAYLINGGRRAIMSGFFVKPNYRSLGVGKQLYNQVLKEVFEVQGCTTMTFNTIRGNEASDRFYKNLGAMDVYEDLGLAPRMHFKGKPFEKF